MPTTVTIHSKKAPAWDVYLDGDREVFATVFDEKEANQYRLFGATVVPEGQPRPVTPQAGSEPVTADVSISGLEPINVKLADGTTAAIHVGSFVLPKLGERMRDLIISPAPQENGEILWAVRNGFEVLSKTSGWAYEPLPSSRDEPWLAEHRFDSLAIAVMAARASQRESLKYCATDLQRRLANKADKNGKR